MNHIPFLVAMGLTLVPITAQRGGFGRGSSQDVWKFLAGKYDNDKDGKITTAEYQRGAGKFQAYDGNGDGVLTVDDFSGGGRRRGRRRGGAGTNDLGTQIGRVLARSADEDENGKVTTKEWKTVLAAVDANQDSTVDAEELGAIMCAALGRKNLSTRAVGRRSRHLDINKDGEIQLAELSDLFAKLDRNDDQVIAKSELGPVRRARPGPPQVGDIAPDFALPRVADEKTIVKLSNFRGKKPVALIFGSYT